MCGIAGFVGTGDEQILRRMAATLSHRGPDDEGFLVDAPLAVHLAHRRLSIVDIGGGHQPMLVQAGRYAVVFNGEIYNFHELRAELKLRGVEFRTDHSDTEVLLQAWIHWREEMFDRLNGMWSFAILDRERRELILSRDRFGKKPLFYYSSGRGFVFSSELTSLKQHPSVPAELSKRALRKYYAYGFVPAPLTFIEGVSKLPGGCWMRLDLDTLDNQVHRYWAYHAEPFDERPAGIEDQWAEQLRAQLASAVNRRLVADVPVGSFLSGGIDSSMVSALAIQKLGHQLKTFSIGFEEATFDESDYAKRVAAHIGAQHQVEMLSAHRALDILPEIVAKLDEPIADSSLLPTYLLCQHARRYVTVALGGDGADELFAGYDTFKALRYADWYEKTVPKPVHRAISVVASRLPVSHRYMSFDFRAKRMLRGLDHAPSLRLPVWMSPLAPLELEALFREPIDLDDLYSEAIDAWDGCRSADPVDRATSFYVRLYLQDDILVKVDRASMLNSLEVRAPFLDRDLVDFARRLPADVKLRGSTTKWILKRAAAPLLPEDVISRRKQGFAIPIGQWFREGKLPEQLPGRSFNPAFWSSALAAHQAGRVDHRLFLWSDWLLGHSHLVGPEAQRARRCDADGNAREHPQTSFPISQPNMPASSIQTEHLDRCPICNGSPRQLISTADFESGTGPYGIDACTECGIAFTNPRPLDSELWKLYASRQTADFAPRAVSLAGAMRRLLMRRRLVRALGATAGETVRLLDYGCGDGSLVAAATDIARRRAVRLEFIGVDFHDEPPPAIVRVGDSAGYLSAEAWENTADAYDHIFIRHVLEHHTDPTRLLRTLAARLRPGGTIHIEVPNRHSFWAKVFGRYFFPYYVPRHLYHFDAESLRHMVAKAGLRTQSLDFGHTPVIGKSLSWRFSVDIDNLGILGLASFPLQVAMDVLTHRSTTLLVKACRE